MYDNFKIVVHANASQSLSSKGRAGAVVEYRIFQQMDTNWHVGVIYVLST